VPEAVALAAQNELRYRNTQAQYTKSQQELTKTKTVNKQLVSKLESSVDLGLTKEETRELKDLQVNNPEAWRQKLTGYEQRAKQRLQTEFAAIEQAGTTESLVETRQQQLAAFVEQTGIQLTDELIQSELPPRYLKELSEGKIDFLTFLTNASDYLTRNKVIKGAKEKPAGEKSLGSMAGGGQPSEEAIGGDIVQKYENTIF
jgi:hypothetical protein